MSGNLLLRIAVAVILILHSVPGMFNNGINDFGKLYLDTQGFAPFGLVIAWAIKLSHTAAAVLLLANRYLKPAAWVTIFILVVGIFMVHLPDGWYVVGGGRNGVEFNFLLIAVLLAIAYPNGLSFTKTKA
ncbi:DoxX family protein [Flavobacterium pedocola]